VKIIGQFTFLVMLVISPFSYGQKPAAANRSSHSQPLEIRLTNPLFWKNGCLWVNIGLINHSKSTIYFSPSPFEGIEIYSSVTQAKSKAEPSGPLSWILVYGWSDVIEPEGKQLSAGRQEERTYCIGENFPVTDMLTGEIRQVHLQGRLRISAGYDRTVAQGRSGNCHEGETRLPQAGVPYHLSRGDHRTYFYPSDILCSGQVTLEIPIPCLAGVTDADCYAPPPIFSGEHDQWTFLPKPPRLPEAPIL
jgi:hypothetical protein